MMWTVSCLPSFRIYDLSVIDKQFCCAVSLGEMQLYNNPSVWGWKVSPQVQYTAVKGREEGIGFYAAFNGFGHIVTR